MSNGLVDQGVSKRLYISELSHGEYDLTCDAEEISPYMATIKDEYLFRQYENPRFTCTVVSVKNAGSRVHVSCRTQAQMV